MERMKSNFSIQLNILQSNIDKLNASILLLLNGKTNESVKLIEERLHLLSNSSSINSIGYDDRHESIEYLKEEVDRGRYWGIALLALIVLFFLSLVSIVCWLARQKRHKSRSLCTNVYGDNLLREEKCEVISMHFFLLKYILQYITCG